MPNPSPRRTKRRLLLGLASVAALVGSLGFGAAAEAAVPGSAIYAPTSSNEILGYARVIRLQNSGSANGQLIGTFEHSTTNGQSLGFSIERSTNDGSSWSKIATVPGDVYTYEPSFFEFPTAIGGYPAGTLLLFGVTLPADRSSTVMREWRSTDHGATWTALGIIQRATGADGTGIWEPEARLDKAGKLNLYFSDERQHDTWSQFLGHIVSTDGGATWSANPDGTTRVSPGEVKDVASANQADRPGMITIAKNAVTGTYAATYEVCGPIGCQVYFKTSSDGDTWGSGPTDIGTPVTTDDGRTLFSTPTITWTPSGGSQGTFLVTANREYRNAGGQPETGQVAFTNTANASGSWRWQPTPILPPLGPWTSTCLVNYSPNMLPSTDGNSIRLTTEGNTGTYGCTLVTGSFNTGVLPYTASFSNGDPGWIEYDGTWSTASNVLTESKGGMNGFKAVTGNTGWTDYTVAGDVKLASTSGSANAGLLARVTDPTSGADTLNGYFIGVDSGNLIVGKEAYGWTPLATKAIPGGLAANAWYHLSVKLSGCSITVQGNPSGSTATPTSLTVNDCSFDHGSIGVRDFGTGASWRSITATK